MSAPGADQTGQSSIQISAGIGSSFSANQHLTIQLIFEDGQIRFEPHPTLLDRINELGLELRSTGYDGQHDAILKLIEEARTSLTSISGQLGPWEAECLEYAGKAINDNFLKLAITQIDKALEVSELPSNEYEAGFNYTTRR